MFDQISVPDSVSRARSAQELLPVSYTDGFVVSSVYLVSTAAARRCIPDCSVQPLVLSGNHSAVVVTLFDFRASSIGPYREVSVGVLVSPCSSRFRTLMQVVKGSAVLGTWVVALPVTSELACFGGIDLFGYPKTLNRIDVDLTPGSCSYVVRDATNDLLAVSVPLGSGLRIPVRQLVTYTQLNGEVRRTVIPVRWSPRISKRRGSRIRVTGDAPLSAIVRSLELPAEPTFVLHGGDFQGTLNNSACLEAPARD